MDLSEAHAENVLQPKTTIISTIKTLPDHLNKCVLHKKYVANGLSAKQIAQEFGVSKTSVLEALKREKIPLRAPNQSHGRPSKPPYGKRYLRGKLVNCNIEQRNIQLIAKLKRQGDSNRAIASHLERLGIPTRQGHPRWHHELIKSILGRMTISRKSKKQTK